MKRSSQKGVFFFLSLCILISSFPISLFSTPIKKEYSSLILRKIKFFLILPEEVKKQGYKGTVKVKFTISKKGKVKKAEILQSSGITSLDKAIIWSIHAAQPYPFPSDSKKASLDIVLPIEFNYLPMKFDHPLLKKEVKKETRSKSKVEVKSKKEIKKVKKGKGKIKKRKIKEKSSIYTLLKNKDYLLKLYQIGAQNSKPLKIREGQIKLTRFKIKETFRELFPYLSVEYKEDKGEAITDKYRSKSYGIKLEHILYDSHQRSDNYRREKLNLEVAEKSYEKERNDLLFEILKAYYQVCAEKEILNLWEKLKREADKDYKLAKLLKEGHLITQIEYLKISSLINRISSELVAQKNRYLLASAHLKKVLGIPPDEKIPKIEFVHLKEKIDLDKKVEDYIKIALKERPEIALWEKSIEATKIGLKIAKNEKKPKLLLESFWGKSGEAYGWQDLDLATTWNVIAKVVWLFGGSSQEISFTHEKTIPTEIVEVSNKIKTDSLSFKTTFLDKFNYYSKVEESKVALTQAQDELEKIKKDIAWEIQEGYTTYLEGKEEIGMYKKEVKLRKQELALNKELFKAGEINLSELIENKIKLAQSYTFLIRAKLKLYQGIILIDKGTGFKANLIIKL